MIKNTIFVSVICVIILFVMGCNKAIYSGTSKTGFSHFPKNNLISPEKALKLATPYIELSYEMRKKNRSSKYNYSQIVPTEYVILNKQYYYITKDNYDSNLSSFYMNYAIRVNKDTGEVMLPQ